MRRRCTALLRVRRAYTICRDTARVCASVLVPLLLASFVAVAVVAQAPGGWGGWMDAGWAGGRHQREMVPSERRGFYACWLAFDRVPIDGAKRGWETDYPMAVRNFMWRLGDFTTTTINTYDDGAMADGVVEAGDAGLFQCPFLFTSDIGGATFSTADADHLREYLLKGGMLWADDFWGRAALDRWTTELARILPEYERVELGKDHPLMSSFYFLDELPQMPSIQSWRRTGGETFERRGFDTTVPTISAVLDENGRVLVLMTHNTDIGDGMEREGADQTYFHLFSPRAYAVAVNIAIYSMTR
jgi:hypothetical protein